MKGRWVPLQTFGLSDLERFNLIVPIWYSPRGQCMGRTEQTDRGYEHPCPLAPAEPQKEEKVISKGTHGSPTPPFPTPTKNNQP